MKNHSTKPERTIYRQYIDGLKAQAETMPKIPKYIYCPGPGKMITAGQYCNAIKVIKAAKPEQEFKQSFQNWAPVEARDILRFEVIPAIHERINIREFIRR